MSDDRFQGRDDGDDRLDGFEKYLGADADFYPDDVEVERMLARVNERIDELGGPVSAPVSIRMTPIWKQALASAAAILLVVGAAYVGMQTGLLVPGGGERETAVVTFDTASLMTEITDYETELYALTDRGVQTLLQEAVAGDGAVSAERLLGDLTDDEYEYLQATFDVGDLL
ncbi:MAG: hypothetical protein RBT76_01125 [candidate division Zixibacteria bacterium]|jgi:hypothetical protein|nr:hypothetical protein [candidate division Zixibacteria bacterium]